MITALNIVKPSRKTFFSKTVPFVRGNKIKVDHLYSDFVAIKSITYTQNRKKANWNTIDKFVKAQRNHILCNEDIPLPKELGYKRFLSFDLNARLCTNLALYLLKYISKSEDITVGIVDDNALYEEFVYSIVNFTDKVCVVTKNYGAYVSLSNRLLDEKGAVIFITKNLSRLKDCDLIVAPELIKTPIQSKDSALILTAQKPKVTMNATTVYKYCFDLPADIKSAKPEYLDDMYFASALYSLSRVYKLGSIVPRILYSDNTVHTVSSLSNILKTRSSE